MLRLLRGEPIDALSRELGIETYRLEGWRERALAALDAGLRERGEDPLTRQLDEAKYRIFEKICKYAIINYSLSLYLLYAFRSVRNGSSK